LFVLSFFIFTEGYEPINESYKGYQVIRYHLLNESSIALAKSIVEEIESADIPIFDIWSATYFIGGSLDISIPPQYVSQMKRIPLPQTVMHEDLLASIEMEKRDSANSTADPFFDSYRTFAEYNSFMNNLVTLGNTNRIVVTRFSAGNSYENRALYGIKISGTTAAKKKIILNGAQHAREWISSTTVAYLAWYLISNYPTNADVRLAVDNFEWHLIPISNPDGYVWTHGGSNNRLWRKNRQPNSGSTCIGTDPNRNWGYYWNNGGTSNNPCQDTYLGPSPFYTPSAKNLAEYISQWRTSKDQCVLYYNDVHCYSQLYMSPWGYTSSLPRDYTTQRAVLEEGAKAIAASYGKQYKFGNIYTTIYQASGSSVDYAYGELGGGVAGGARIRYAFTFELRDEGQYGFILPANQIDPQGIEICNCLISTAKYFINNKIECP